MRFPDTSSMTSFMEKSPNTDPVSFSPDLRQHTTYPYCMRTNFSDNLSDRFVQGLDVFSRRGLSEWHKLPLIKILTIHAKWSFSVNTAEGESKWLWWAFGEWGLGFSFSIPVVLSWGKPVLRLEMCLSDHASTLSKKLTAVYRMLLWQSHQLFIYSARPLIRKMSNGAFTLEVWCSLKSICLQSLVRLVSLKVVLQTCVHRSNLYTKSA